MPGRASPHAQRWRATTTGRLALVIGNRNCPEPFDLPSIHKKARDVHLALIEGRRRGAVRASRFKSQLLSHVGKEARQGLHGEEHVATRRPALVRDAGHRDRHGRCET